MNILITSWRTVVSLEFLRLLHSHENNLFVIESQENFMSKHSRYLKKYVLVHTPKYEFEKYKKDVLHVIKHEKIDLVIPTCEDIFYISRFKDEIESLGCKIISDTFEKLKLFHSKIEIMKISENLWVLIPLTLEFNSLEKLKDYIEKNPDFRYVAKPKYSRFSSFISSNAMNDTIGLDDIKIDLSSNSYILQEYVPWQVVCSYSIFDKWKLVSHLNYKSILNYKNWASTYFESFENDSILNFVRNFAKKFDFDWQISFDFIITSDNKIYLIECNPRTTSWLHLLKNNAEFKETFLNYAKQKPYNEFILKWTIWKWLSFINLMYTFDLKKVKHWLKSLVSDVVFDTKDYKPFVWQIKLLKWYKKIAKEKNIALSEVTVFWLDYDWEE